MALSGAPARPVVTARISAAMASAISSGVSEPRSSPAGARTRGGDASQPLSSFCARWREPIAPR